jgi:predicted phosphodiesterase
MKIGIVSDIHANPRALRRALEDMGSVDMYLCAGSPILRQVGSLPYEFILGHTHVPMVHKTDGVR